MIIYTRQFLKWVKPLLTPEEMYILLNHIDDDPEMGFVLYHTGIARKRIGKGRHQLRRVRDKLEILAHLYELEVLAFPDSFN